MSHDINVSITLDVFHEGEQVGFTLESSGINDYTVYLDEPTVNHRTVVEYMATPKNLKKVLEHTPFTDLRVMIEEANKVLDKYSWR